MRARDARFAFPLNGASTARSLTRNVERRPRSLDDSVRMAELANYLSRWRFAHGKP